MASGAANPARKIRDAEQPMMRRDGQLSEPAKIAAGSLTEEMLDECFFRVPTTFLHLAIEFTNLRLGSFDIHGWKAAKSSAFASRNAMHSTMRYTAAFGQPRAAA